MSLGKIKFQSLLGITYLKIKIELKFDQVEFSFI